MQGMKYESWEEEEKSQLAGDWRKGQLSEGEPCLKFLHVCFFASDLHPCAPQCSPIHFTRICECVYNIYDIYVGPVNVLTVKIRVTGRQFPVFYLFGWPALSCVLSLLC